jgi:hypothetical protein
MLSGRSIPLLDPESALQGCEFSVGLPARYTVKPFRSEHLLNAKNGAREGGLASKDEFQAGASPGKLHSSEEELPWPSS